MAVTTTSERKQLVCAAGRRRKRFGFMRPLVEIDFVENFGQRFNLLIDGFRKVFSDSLRERIFGFGKLCYAFTSFLGNGVKLIMTFMRIKKTLGKKCVGFRFQR